MEIQLLRKWIFLSSIYHLNMICLGYNTGLHQYTPITSYQGIKCGGDFGSAESLEKAMQACDRLEKCTSIATDLNWHRAFPIDERDYDHGCGSAGHHYIETFHLCEGNIHSKYSGVFDCAFTRGRIVYFDLVLGVEVVIYLCITIFRIYFIGEFHVSDDYIENPNEGSNGGKNKISSDA